MIYYCNTKLKKILNMKVKYFYTLAEKIENDLFR
jgi:hypothetical protein